jgi:dihydroflavonol-4-reductase
MILVTGGTGLIGTYLLHELMKQSKQVRVLIRNQKTSQNVLDLFKCLDPLATVSPGQLEWVDGDVLDVDSLKVAFAGITQVYHCAAMVTFRREEVALMQRINVLGTENIIAACLRNKVSKLVHVSSISALGLSTNNLPLDENSYYSFSHNQSHYSRSKYLSEQQVVKAKEQGLRFVIVNPSNIIGVNRAPGNGSHLIDQITKYYPFYTDGFTGYIDVRDVTTAMILLMESDVEGERFVLNAENLGQRELWNYTKLALEGIIPPIHISKKVLIFLSQLEKLRSEITGKESLLTSENICTITSKLSYTADKFSNKFNFQFIPIKESIKYMFHVLEMLKRIQVEL